MRILLATASCLPAYGGPAFLVCKLAEMLEAREVDVSIWAADGSAARTPLLDRAASARRLTGALRDAVANSPDFDIVHDHGIWLRHNHRLARLSSRRGVPRVVSVHGMLDPWCLKHKALKKRIAWTLYQRADLRAAAALFVTSGIELRNVRELELDLPIETIPIGVDLPAGADLFQRATRARSCRTAVYLGRLHPVKGLPMLLEAWAAVRPIDWELQIAGPDEADHQKTLEALVDANGLRDKVSFVGPLHGIAKRDFLLSADLFVLPSHSESFGLAIAEALGHGLPVLTTKATPWTILEAENCGWCVRPDMTGMVEGLTRATSTPSGDLAKMGRLGRKWAGRHLQWDHIADRFLVAYQHAMSRAAGINCEKSARLLAAD